MKRFKLKATSKKTNSEVFYQLSKCDLIVLRGGTAETPPEECDSRDRNE